MKCTAYTRDPITGNLAAFDLPKDYNPKLEQERKFVIEGIRQEIKSKSAVVLIRIDFK